MWSTDTMRLRRAAGAFIPTHACEIHRSPKETLSLDGVWQPACGGISLVPSLVLLSCPWAWAPLDARVEPSRPQVMPMAQWPALYFPKSAPLLSLVWGRVPRSHALGLGKHTAAGSSLRGGCHVGPARLPAVVLCCASQMTAFEKLCGIKTKNEGQFPTSFLLCTNFRGFCPGIISTGGAKRPEIGHGASASLAALSSLLPLLSQLLGSLCVWHLCARSSWFCHKPQHFFSHKNGIAKQKQRRVYQIGRQLPAEVEFPSHCREQSHDPLPQR